MAGSRVFTIAPGIPFLPALVEAILDGPILDGRHSPDTLASATIYLPTRRAARAFAALLGEALGRGARLLPRIIPLGEADEAEFELSGGADAALEGAEHLAPPISPLERRLVLTRLIQRWVEVVDRALLTLPADVPLLVPASPADAVTLAADLEGLMDAFATEDVPWEELAQAVEADYSSYFRVTLDFVRIAAEAWPKILADRGASDPARRRTALIAAEARRLTRDVSAAPVIAAGSTGSVPATAALLAAIANLPGGAVVLPGLDHHLDEPGWRAVGTAGADGSDLVHGHPQAMVRQLLDRYLRMERRAVRALGTLPSWAQARGRLLSEALRPADTTDRWAAADPSERAAIARQGCDGLALVEAVDEREEALAAAIALREAIAEPGRTAALVTPDRALAARVKAELGRWGLFVEDSAGVPLSETPAGRLARLAADAAAHDFEPGRLLALLAHPDIRLGPAREEVERGAAALEIGVLRGPAPGPGLAGIMQALELSRGVAAGRHVPRARRRLDGTDWSLAVDLLQRLAEAFGRFSIEAVGEAALDLVALADAHHAAFEALRRATDGAEAEEDEGSADALLALFEDLAASETGGVRGRLGDYPAFFTTLARQRTIAAPARATHRRLKILGLLEARLLTADRVVLGGLDEGVWPPRIETDAFLNRPMRSRVGLSPPERRIGQTAHDFVQALGARDAVITRARKRDGSPMVPSRFLQRMQAFAGEEAWSGVVARGARYLRFARALESPPAQRPLPPPAPRVEPASFPRALSVTEIETLVRDPYSIFARHVLKLDPLDPVAGVPTAAERGTILHDILAGFAAEHPGHLPDHALESLLNRGQAAFGPIEDAYPELYAEWWPRFQRLATAFVVWERARRPDIVGLYPETSGSLAIPLPDGSVFQLRARADRIETRSDGSMTIIDYKTGSPPSCREVFAGFSPQLTLEAAIALAGGFKGLPGAPEVPDLLYVRSSGGRKPLEPLEVKPPRGETRSVAALVAEHRARLETLLARYISGDAVYLSRPFPQFAHKFSKYDHLARVKEWSAASAGGDEGGE